jgi:predicted signal transduction protein with EAL and GGDEF domain
LDTLLKLNSLKLLGASWAITLLFGVVLALIGVGHPLLWGVICTVGVCGVLKERDEINTPEFFLMAVGSGVGYCLLAFS